MLTHPWQVQSFLMLHSTDAADWTSFVQANSLQIASASSYCCAERLLIWRSVRAYTHDLRFIDAVFIVLVPLLEILSLFGYLLLTVILTESKLPVCQSPGLEFIVRTFLIFW